MYVYGLEGGGGGTYGYGAGLELQHDIVLFVVLAVEARVKADSSAIRRER